MHLLHCTSLLGGKEAAHPCAALIESASLQPRVSLNDLPGMGRSFTCRADCLHVDANLAVVPREDSRSQGKTLSLGPPRIPMSSDGFLPIHL